MKALTALLLLPLSALAAVPVTTTPLAELLTAVERNAPGTVVPLNDAALSAEISARVTEIEVRVGDQVEPDAVLVRLDCRYYEAQLAAALAELNRLKTQRKFAEQQLKRARDLRRQKSVSAENLEQRESEVDQLLGQIGVQEEQQRQAEIQTERCIVRAPFRGVVTERLASIGELANPGTPLLRLVQLDELEVSAELVESEIRALSAARDINFRFGGVEYPLRLRRLLPVIDERRRTRIIRFQFLGSTPPSGAAGRLSWRGSQDSIPTALVVRRDGELGVFIAVDGKARFHPLRGAIEGQSTSVDLPPGSLIIIEGQQSLNDGDELAIRADEP